MTNTQQPKKTISREELIQTLIDQKHDLYNDGLLSLDDLLSYGHTGYNNMSNKELEDTYNEDLEDDEKFYIQADEMSS